MAFTPGGGGSSDLLSDGHWPGTPVLSENLSKLSYAFLAPALHNFQPPSHPRPGVFLATSLTTGRGFGIIVPIGKMRTPRAREVIISSLPWIIQQITSRAGSPEPKCHGEGRMGQSELSPCPGRGMQSAKALEVRNEASDPDQAEIPGPPLIHCDLPESASAAEPFKTKSV